MWNEDEHQRLINACKLGFSGRGKWKRISQVVLTRTPAQCKSHHQKFKQRLFIDNTSPEFRKAHTHKYLERILKENLREETSYSLDLFNDKTTDITRETFLIILEILKSILDDNKNCSITEKSINSQIVSVATGKSIYIIYNILCIERKENKWWNWKMCPKIEDKKFVNSGGWTYRENQMLMQLVHKFGTKWQVVAQYLKTRRATQCKSHYQKFQYKSFNERKSKNAELCRAKIYFEHELIPLLKGVPITNVEEDSIKPSRLYKLKIIQMRSVLNNIETKFPGVTRTKILRVIYCLIDSINDQLSNSEEFDDSSSLFSNNMYSEPEEDTPKLSILPLKRRKSLNIHYQDNNSEGGEGHKRLLRENIPEWRISPGVEQLEESKKQGESSNFRLIGGHTETKIDFNGGRIEPKTSSHPFSLLDNSLAFYIPQLENNESIAFSLHPFDPNLFNAAFNSGLISILPINLDII